MRIWRCETKEQYNFLLKQLEREGCTWDGGEKPTQVDNWGKYKENTCIAERNKVVNYEPTDINEWEEYEHKTCIIEYSNGQLKYAEKEEYESKYPKVKIECIILPDTKEVQKVVIPTYIAEWIEESKDNYENWTNDAKGNFIIRCAYDLFQHGEGKPTYDFYIDDDISEWTKDNPYTFIRAVIDGYKVEDCYVVILPNSTSTLPNSTSTTHYLQRSKTGKVKLVEGVFELNHHTRLTKQEIESLDKRYFAFAEKVN